MTLPKALLCFFLLAANVEAQKRYEGKVLEKGQSDRTVQLMQYDLYFLGYGIYLNPYGGASGTYNDATARAVTAFQADKELFETGVMDTKTAEVLEKALGQNELGDKWPLFNPLRYQGNKFQRGDKDRGKGHVVELLQKDLTALGYSIEGDEPGMFGLNTEEAIKTLQEDYAIPSNGTLDENTTNAVVSRLCIKGVLAKEKKKK